MTDGQSPSLVVVGGGTGAPRLVKSLSTKLADWNLTLVCPTTDSGRSTGVARRLFRIPAPGDLRHAMTALSALPDWAGALEQRIECDETSDLNGMAVGNLILASLIQSGGDIGRATVRLSRLLDVDVTVLPVSIEDIQLAATLDDGTTVTGEFEVRRPGKPAIRSLSVEGEAEGAWPPVVEAVERANWIVLGPGSLYTSLGACLAVKGMRQAINRASAKIVFICNSTSQPGQTEGMSFVDHVRAVEELAGRRPDIVVANTVAPAPVDSAKLENDGLAPVVPTETEITELAANGVRVLGGDLLAGQSAPVSLWQKLHTAYHDMDRVSEALAGAFRVR